MNYEEGDKMEDIGVRSPVASFALVFSILVLVIGGLLPFAVEDVDAQEEELILRMGCRDEMKTRNILSSGDIWTENVLSPVYDTVVHVDPETDEILPFILKGTDANGNEQFDEEEYGVFTSLPGKPLEVTAFYDFNGVLFHDGYQATVEDLLFTYHMEANDPRAVFLDVLKDKNNIGGNYTVSKWLWLFKLKGFDSVGDWDAHPPYTNYSNPNYDKSLRAAVHFNLQVPYYGFNKNVLSWRILPRHLWEGTGCIYDRVQGSFNCDIHRKSDGTLMDFGYAYDPDIGNGNPGRPGLMEFDFASAESWNLPDEYVIGTGPFKFETWQRGAFAYLTKNDDFYEGEPYIHKPYIDGMLFKVYRTTQTAVFALKSGDIDYIAWSIPPDFVPELLQDSNVAIVSSPEKGFSYLSYNMRKIPFGYPDGDPANGDVGANFRQAVAHLIDQDTIVSSILRYYGIVADGPVSPMLSRWYNSSLPTFGFDVNAADGLLDTYWPWDTTDGPCQSDGSGCRSFPGIGVEEIEILVPAADYDPIQAASGNLIAQAMRAAGINARAVPTHFGEIVQRIDARDFEMYISNWRIGSDPPDYLFDFFYSKNRDAGQNHPGYQSDEFDDIILRAREELDSLQQSSLVKQAQGILANDRPYDYLFFRDNIEAYRCDKFINWTVGEEGSIFHYWSWLGIHEPPPESLRITASIPSSVRIDEVAHLVVTVRDPNGDILPGATVSSFVDSRNGHFVLGPVTSNLVSGETDVNGQLSVAYVPPTLVGGGPARIVLIHTIATHPSHSESRNATVCIIVYPIGVYFLSLLVDLPGGDTVMEGSTALLKVEVMDQGLNMVSGANVTITATPPAAIVPNGGTTDFNGWVNGVQHIEFEAPRVDRDTQYAVTIRATLTDYESAQMGVSLTVVNNIPPSIMIASPSSGTRLSGSVVVNGTASDSDGDWQLAWVEFRIDNGMWQLAAGTTNWKFELDTTQLENGNHVLHVRAYDGAEYSREAMLSFTVSNIPWLWIAVGIVVPVVVVTALFILLRRRGQTPQPYAPTQSTQPEAQPSGPPSDLERP